MADTSPLIPEITDEDIQWARELMGLAILDEPRAAFLTSRSTLDVSACPGSGKTTLVVAKLAILVRKWPYRTKGICVLSHTNVAREEIQHKLGRTVVGQRLLRHPHFIDTIHGFANRFLALPWLSSNGDPSPTISDDVATAYRRGVLTKAERATLETFLEKKYSSFDRLRICDRDLGFDLAGKVFPAKPDTNSYKLARKAIKASAEAGYFCYDEMFVWAHALLDDFPDVASWLRRRFPLVMIDEMQDTLDVQGAILNAVFPRTSPEMVVQRVGDSNQAVFGHFEAQPDQSDRFPDLTPARNLVIPNSHRFGPAIAAFASGLAVAPVGTGGLCGIDPKAISGAPAACPHAIFIFPDSSTAGLLDAYGRHVLAVFDDKALAAGAVTAVGAVHKDASGVPPGDPQFPKSVPHYWSGYNADISSKDPHPKSLLEYVRAAQAVVRDGHDLSPGVERLASGLVRLAGRVGDVGKLRSKMRAHRTIVDVLSTDAALLASYRRLIGSFLFDWTPLTEANWGPMQNDMLDVASALCNGAAEPAKAAEFLAWPGDNQSLVVGSPGSPKDSGPNVCRVAHGARYVDIRLGSIHSVKGQTHLATMVLSTYWHKHSFGRMLPWFVGQRSNGNDAGVQDLERLRQTYVAMTRPSHLVCLAAPRSAFGDDYLKHLTTLSARGWRLAEVIDGVTQWRA